MIDRLQARSVDERDLQWEQTDPRYRVFFFEESQAGGYSVDAWEIQDALYDSVLLWAEAHARARNYSVGLVVDVGPNGRGLIWLHGRDLNES